jgi:uncharacterized membrane protein YfcA
MDRISGLDLSATLAVYSTGGRVSARRKHVLAVGARDVSGGSSLTVVAIGAVVGFLSGLFGKGGSAVATPLLSVTGVPAIVAVASPLPGVIPSTLAASYAYWREGFQDWRVIGWSTAIGIPATAFGAYASRWTGGEPLVIATEVILMVLGARFLIHPGDPVERATNETAPLGRIIPVAAVVGVLSGLLANGGGFLLAPLYVVVLQLPLKQAFACSLTVATALAIPGTIVHAALGHIDWAIVALFSITAVPLAYVGARVALRTHARRLERIYGAGLLALGAVTLVLSL